MKEKHNGKSKLEQHSHKREITDYKCEQHMNPCMKTPTSALQLYENSLEKHTQQKLQWFQPLLLLQEVYL